VQSNQAADRAPAGPVDPTTDAPVVLRPLPLGGARIGAGLWAQRQQVNRDVTIPEGERQLHEAGNINNLRLAAGTGDGTYRGPVFQDSDVYKWLEAVAWEQGRAPSETLAQWQRDVTAVVADAQAADGYVNSFVQVTRGDTDRFADLPFGHELYCAGHLIQAAVAQYRATGREELLQVATRFADYIGQTFGTDRLNELDGHEVVETALVELYRLTGQRAYLETASYFIDARGHGLIRPVRDSSYFQDRVPVREATTVEGHAVRAMYLAAGATDVYAETGDKALVDALVRQWESMTGSKTYLTGGLGSRWDGEAFGDPYELPADRGYCETCAAIGSIHWSWRMLLTTGEARYADLIERTLFNGFLAGISLRGNEFFYVNALQLRSDAEKNDSRNPAYGRRPWFNVACCPPNIMRLLSSLDTYLASTDDAGVQLHQYAAGEIRTAVGAAPVALDVATDYPWDGRVEVRIGETPDRPWALSLRVPAWCAGAQVSVNGDAVGDEPWPGSYLRIEREWRTGDRVVLTLPMPARRTVADERTDVRGCVAIERGPLVYCFEQTDQPDGVVVDDLVLDDAPLTEVRRDDLLGGVTIVETTGRTVRRADPAAPLYRAAVEEPQLSEPVRLTAVPYYAWANRELGPMRVWTPRR
jgi:uncharacterized protein